MPDRGIPGRETNGGTGDGLERELRELGARFEYPPTPDLAAAVRRRLDEDASPASPGYSLPVWAVAAAVIAVFVVVPALAFVTFAPFGGDDISGGGQVAGSGEDAEKAAPEGAQGDSMTAESQQPAGSEAEAPSSEVGTDADQPSAASDPSSPLGEGIGFRERISLEEAEVRMGSLLLTSGLGPPDEVYAVDGPTGNGVAFVYAARESLPPMGDTAAGLVLTELPGDVEAAFGTGTAVPHGAEAVDVGGARGIWLATPSSSGAEAFRLTPGLRGSTLFFTRDGLALRVESSLAREEAIGLAESVE
jgi:hypothetical protein